MLRNIAWLSNMHYSILARLCGAQHSCRSSNMHTCSTLASSRCSCSASCLNEALAVSKCRIQFVDIAQSDKGAVVLLQFRQSALWWGQKAGHIAVPCALALSLSMSHPVSDQQLNRSCIWTVTDSMTLLQHTDAHQLMAQQMLF